MMALGLFLMSRIDEHTKSSVLGWDMVVFGLGIGLTMQVLTIATQNNVDYADLGVATSGVTYFRSIGGSFGASIFGTILNNDLSSKVTASLHNGTLSPKFPVTQILGDPTSANKLPRSPARPVPAPLRDVLRPRLPHRRADRPPRVPPRALPARGPPAHGHQHDRPRRVLRPAHLPHLAGRDRALRHQAVEPSERLGTLRPSHRTRRPGHLRAARLRLFRLHHAGPVTEEQICATSRSPSTRSARASTR
jgi:hypothetical protein